jgi:tRNA/rRNA methyltransferase
VALVFGPEKHGLTREDLSYCHLMVEIPTDSRQPSMNLGQAVAVCLYELTLRPLTAGAATQATDAVEDQSHATSTSDLDRLAAVVEEVMLAADYSPPAMQEANRYDLRLLLRRLALARRDTRRILGLFRRILWQLKRTKNTG